MKQKVFIKENIMMHLQPDSYKDIIHSIEVKYGRVVDELYLEQALHPGSEVWDNQVIQEAQLIILARNETIIENKETLLKNKIGAGSEKSVKQDK